MSDPLERIRTLVQVADPDGTVTVRWLAEIIGEQLEDDPDASEALPAEMTVEDVAKEVGRAPSTVRGWLCNGELRGYRFNGREWRVPVAALREYRERQASTDAPLPSPGSGEDVDISAWRQAS